MSSHGTSRPVDVLEQVDVIDQVVGIAPGDRLDTLRRSRPVARQQVQAAEDALFGSDGAGIDLPSRWLVGAFVAELTVPGSALAAHRRSALDETTSAVLGELLAEAPPHGPRGSYREPGLVAESDPVERWRIAGHLREQVGEPLATVLEHAHLLVVHPRDSRPEALDRLLEAGWSRAQVVTWSQLVSFVSFQARIAHGLAVIATSGSGVGAPDPAPASPATATAQELP